MTHRSARRLTVAAVATMILGAAATAFAAGGALDTSFGTGGAVVFNAPGSGGDFFSDVAVQPDGKILAVGKYIKSGTSTYKWLIARYTETGALDTSFAAPNGYLLLFGSTGSAEMAFSMAFAPDGRVYVCGSVRSPLGDSDVAVVSLNVDGSLDTSFGAGGSTRANLQTQTVKKTTTRSQDYGYGIVLDPDGKIVVSARSDLGATSGALVRFLSTGMLDTTFGGGDGVVLAPVPQNSSGFFRVARGASGAYVCLASDALSRYDTTGVLDASFGRRVFVNDFGFRPSVWDLAVQSDGNILVSAYAPLVPPPAPAYAMILRYLPGGLPDRSYGSNGHAIAGGPGWGCTALTLQPDGKAILGVFFSGGARLARFDVSGALDPSFGTGGLGAPFTYSVRAAAVDAAGRIMLAGGGSGSAGSGPSVIRCLGN